MPHTLRFLLTHLTAQDAAEVHMPHVLKHTCRGSSQKASLSITSDCIRASGPLHSVNGPPGSFFLLQMTGFAFLFKGEEYSGF